MSITRLVYISQNQIDPAQGSVVRQLAAILQASKRNNQPLGITGALVFDDKWFLQVLEGDRRAIWRQFQRIDADERHSDVQLIEMREVGARLFGNWWMGLATRTPATERLFAPFSRNGRLMADAMSATDILDLMVALTEHGLSRERSAPVDPVVPGVAA